jgi:hypothetical protein
LQLPSVSGKEKEYSNDVKLMHPLVEKLRQKDVYVHTTGDHIVMQCIKCQKLGKMYFNVKKSIGDCKVCGQVFLLIDIYKFFNIKQEDSGAKSFEEFEELVESMTEDPQKLLPIFRQEDLSGTPESLPKKLMYYGTNLDNRSSSSFLLKYWYDWLTDKGLRTPRNSGCCAVCVDSEHKYYRKLIIPIRDYFTDEYLGYQARKRYDDEYGPKYIFSKGFSKKNTLYVPAFIGFTNDHVPIVENAIVAQAYNGVATFGKSMSNEQVDKLILLQRAFPRLKFTLMWDDDAFNKIGERTSAVESALDKLKDDVNIRVVRIKGQPDDYTKTAVREAQEKAWSQLLRVTNLC